MDQRQVETFIERYISMWHESDPERRRQIVRSLWAEDAANYTRNSAAHGIDRELSSSMDIDLWSSCRLHGRAELTVNLLTVRPA